MPSAPLRNVACKSRPSAFAHLNQDDGGGAGAIQKAAAIGETGPAPHPSRPETSTLARHRTLHHRHACRRGGRPGTTTPGPEGATGRRGAEGPGQARPAARRVGGQTVRDISPRRHGSASVGRDGCCPRRRRIMAGRCKQALAWLQAGVASSPPPWSCLSEKLSSARPWEGCEGRLPGARPPSTQPAKLWLWIG